MLGRSRRSEAAILKTGALVVSSAIRPARRRLQQHVLERYGGRPASSYRIASHTDAMRPDTRPSPRRPSRIPLHPRAAPCHLTPYHTGALALALPRPQHSSTSTIALGGASALPSPLQRSGARRTTLFFRDVNSEHCNLCLGLTAISLATTLTHWPSPPPTYRPVSVHRRRCVSPGCCERVRAAQSGTSPSLESLPGHAMVH